MLSKSARYALISAACLKLGVATRVNSVLYPSSYDVTEETTLARERDKGELPADDDLPDLRSQLDTEERAPFCSSIARKQAQREERATLLTEAERQQVRRERAAYLVKRDLSAPRNAFALAIV